MNGQWNLTYQDSSTFGPGFRLASTVSAWYLPGSQSVIQRTSNSYDGNGFLISTLVEQMDSGSWRPRQRATFMIDLRGYDTLYTSETWVDTQWVYQNRTSFVNDSTGRVLQAIDCTWQSNQWVNQRRQTLSYPPDRSFHYLSEDWLGGAWVPTLREVEQYDVNGNLTSEVYEYYVSGAWVLRSSLVNTYNTAALLIHGECQGEDGSFYARDGFDNKYYFSGRSIDIAYRTLITGVEQTSGSAPSSYQLLQNYPNPFNPTTTIRYSLPKESFVTLIVYNTLGQQVAEPVSEQQQAGYHNVEFRADGLASGVYFYRLQTGDFVQTKRLLLLK